MAFRGGEGGEVSEGFLTFNSLDFFVVWTLRLGLRPSHQFEDVLSTRGWTQHFKIPSKLGCGFLSSSEAAGSCPDGGPSASPHFLTLGFPYLVQVRRYMGRRYFKLWDRPWACTGGVTL